MNDMGRKNTESFARRVALRVSLDVACESFWAMRLKYFHGSVSLVNCFGGIRADDRECYAYRVRQRGLFIEVLLDRIQHQ